MGQCMSTKAKTAFAASAVAVHHHHNMPRHQRLDQSPEDETKSKKRPDVTKGVATSFGFKRRPAGGQVAPPVAGNPTAARRLANASPRDSNLDSNGNDGATDGGKDDTEPLTSNAASTGRSTPHRLPAPKKEAAATKISRFGFRQPNTNRMNRVADINTNPPTHMEYSVNNNNVKNVEKLEEAIKAKVEMQNRITDTNRNKSKPAKFTLQTTQLPKPVPVKFYETKTAKTLANNNRKVQPPPGDESASMTEDSGVGSNYGDNIPQLEHSPMFRRSKVKARNLEVIVSGNTFDLKDLDEGSENSVTLSLPPLPSAFQRHSSGFVRDRTAEYQRNIERRHSLTSSEASSHYEEEKIKPKTFLKPHLIESSPPSSDDQMWSNAGEAMADEFSCSFSSSDESKDQLPENISCIENTIQNKVASTIVPKSIILSIEDAANQPLLQDETSPNISLTCSFSEDNDKKLNKSSSNSKDINEKLTASTPGSPTNASNSLSLSEGRDDFLIDDEIADQPALLFDDTITASNQTSEATPTLVDSTPKPRRRIGAFEGSPLVLRSKRLLSSRTGSLDTLSPCESITSDDFIMDFELSQSSGLEDANDRTEQDSKFSLDDVQVRKLDLTTHDITRDWSALLAPLDHHRTSPRRLSRPSRLLRSRAGTPGSNPDSPRSVEALKSKPVSQSPLRLSSSRSSTTGTAGYDSDDSVIRVDRAQHSAMQQDVMNIKTMLLKLKRVLHEPADEEFLLKSETRNSLENGFFNGFGSDKDDQDSEREDMGNMRRQILFLQGQLEDRERTVEELQQEMVRLVAEHQSSQSAPASVTTVPAPTCNAATQTERLRPISAGPSLLQGSPVDGNPGSLVSASEVAASARRSRGPAGRLWRTPGEPAVKSSIPRRSCSRNRTS